MTADEAQLARAQLESVGIDAVVLHEGASRVIPGLGATGGIPLDVDEADYDTAVETLATVPEVDEKEIAAHPELAPESVLPPGKKEPAKVPGQDAASRAGTLPVTADVLSSAGKLGTAEIPTVDLFRIGLTF